MNKKSRNLMTIIVVIVIFIPLTVFAYKAIMLRKAENNVGTISIKAMIYVDVDKGLTEIHPLELSKMYYVGNMILEEVEENNKKLYSLFNKKHCTPYTADLDSLHSLPVLSIKEKKHGIISLKDSISNYLNRIAMQDTVLDEITYRRFAVRNPNEYSIFYIQNSLNIPFSFNRVIEKDYNGTISRIDSYKIKEDTFISITLSAEKTIQKTYFKTISNQYFKFIFTL